MNRLTESRPVDGRAAQMRAEFDDGFTRVPVAVEADLTDVLALRLGEVPALLRLGDIAEVIAEPVLTPVPGPVPALLGIAVGRGVPVAAYDLGLLFDQGPVAPRWLLLLASEPGIGIVFEHFDGFYRLGPDAARSDRLIEVPALIDTIRQFGPGSRKPLLERQS